MENNDERGIFINGKQQMIDMLKHMNINDRKKLIANLSSKNISMARELSEQSVSYKDLELISDEKLQIILNDTNPAILGLALFASSKSFQRRCLSLIPRQEAEKSFQIMQMNLNSKINECRRAQQKILETAVNLIKQNAFTL